MKKIKNLVFILAMVFMLIPTIVKADLGSTGYTIYETEYIVTDNGEEPNFKSGYGIQYDNITDEETLLELKTIIPEEADIINAFDMKVLDENKEPIEVADSDYIIDIYNPEFWYMHYNEYEKLQAVYIVDGQIKETSECDKSGFDGYLYFKTSNFGRFVIYGIKKEQTFISGDLDGDSNITVDDAVEALYYYIEKYEVTSDILAIGDIDKDGKITVDDAVDILMLYVNK